MQRVPQASRGDVERVVRRDYALGDQPVALDVLGAYRGGIGEPHRVHLAALKLANGDLSKLRDWIASANTDFRDVLVAAEYPSAFSRGIALDSLPPPARQQIYDADWHQYDAWLRRA